METNPNKSKNINDVMADFAKVGYYDTIAESNKKLEKNVI